jgi:hypothetical protein
MPTADSFTALGMGNGFPFCPPKVDVSSNDLWSTIDGYNKSSTGTRTAAGIAESKRLAMLYVWNTYQLTGSASAGIYSVSDINSEDNADTITGDPLTPKSRFCLDGFGGFGDYTDIEGSPYRKGYIDLYVSLSVTAMYDGSTSDENNFVGYGIGSISAYIEDEELADYLWVTFHCTGGASVSEYSFERDSQYTSLSMGSETFHGVGVAEVESVYGSETPTVNGSTLSATCSFASSPDDISVSASLSSLTAYTY